MLACCSPADLQFKETVDTLRFATRASAIVNNAKQNLDKIMGGGCGTYHGPLLWFIKLTLHNCFNIAYTQSLNSEFSEKNIIVTMIIFSIIQISLHLFATIVALQTLAIRYHQ